MFTVTYDTPSGPVAFPVMDMSDVELMVQEMALKKIGREPRRGLGQWEATYGDASFQDLKAPPEVGDAALHLAESVAAGNCRAGLLICGPSGVGKTWAAAAVANYAIDAGKRVEFTSMRHLIASMPYGLELSVLNSLTRNDLVVIDDLGAERNTQTGVETAFSVIDALYSAQVPMLITTNLTPRYIAEAKGGESRMYDRIKERCRVVEYLGPNKRQGRLTDAD